MNDAIAYFDSLPPVRTDEIRGRYRGEELRTGHPMEGKLAAAGWYGKQFDGEDKVHPLLFEARERHVHRADADLTSRALLDVAADRGAVGAVAETQQRHQHELFELADHRREVVSSMFHIVKYIS